MAPQVGGLVPLPGASVDPQKAAEAMVGVNQEQETMAAPRPPEEEGIDIPADQVSRCNLEGGTEATYSKGVRTAAC